MAILTEDLQRKIEEILVESEALTIERLGELSAQAKEMGKPLFSLMVSEKVISDEQLTEAIARASDVPYVNLSGAVIDSKVLDLLAVDVAQRFMAVPLGETDDKGSKRLAVAMLDASNVQAVDFLSNAIGRPIKVYMASDSGINNVLSQYSISVNNSVDSAVIDAEANASTTIQKSNAKVIHQDSPISKILTQILEHAQRSRASDVHIEPMETEIKVRCRIDGVLRVIMVLPKSIEAALVSRVKILANLKIDEHRKPQDGQFAVIVGDKEVDLRIAISPVIWGEQVVIRLLDKSNTSFNLEEMGFAGRALRTIRKGIRKPNGMVLTSGPTGSGKSTTLYALVQEIFTEEVNIVTLEDPVEYKMKGINQIQVNPVAGLTFASGMRSILRQDPDVVLVGEIRDAETANLAVQAALTGHLVFSTLHTNSASGILPRLIDMGIEPFLIASTVNTVIGQRLARRVSNDREAYQSNEIETQSVKDIVGHLLPTRSDQIASYTEDLGYENLPLANSNSFTLVKGKESQLAPGGYKGRLGLYEAMDITEEVQQLIVKHATSSQIQRLAIAQGMITLQTDGYLKALNGLTTIEEINRIAANMA